MQAYIISTKSFQNKSSSYCNEFYSSNEIFAASSSYVSAISIHGILVGPRIFYGLRQSALINWSLSRSLNLGGSGYCRLTAYPCDCACACDCHKRRWGVKPPPREQWKGRRVASVKWKWEGDGYDSSEDGSCGEIFSLLTNANVKSVVDGVSKSRNQSVHVSGNDKSEKIVKGTRQEGKCVGREDSEDRSLRGEMVARTIEKYKRARSEGSRQFESSSSYYSASSGGDFQNSLDLISTADQRFNGESDKQMVIDLKDDVQVKKQNTSKESSSSYKNEEVQDRARIHQKHECEVVKSTSRQDRKNNDVSEFQKQETRRGSSSAVLAHNRRETKEDTSTSYVHSTHDLREHSSRMDQDYSEREECWGDSKRLQERSEMHRSGTDIMSRSEKASNVRETNMKNVRNSALVSVDEARQHGIRSDAQVQLRDKNGRPVKRHVTSETERILSSQRRVSEKQVLEEEIEQKSGKDLSMVRPSETRKEYQRHSSTSDISATATGTKAGTILSSTSDIGAGSTGTKAGTIHQKERMVLSGHTVLQSSDKHNQMNEQSTKRLGLRMESQRLAKLSEFYDSELERASNSQMVTLMRTKKQDETSTSELKLSEKKRKQQAVLSKEEERNSLVSESSSNLKSSSTGMQEISSEAMGDTVSTGKDSTYKKHSALTVKDDVLASADRLDKSSKEFVGDFVDKAQKEISATHELFVSLNEEKYVREEHALNVNVQMTLDGLRRSSSAEPGPKGPSDEMWSEDVPSSQEQLVTESSGKEHDSPNVAVKSNALVDVGSTAGKRSGRSLWGYIGDVVRRNWSPRAETRKPTTRPSAMSSSNESAASDTWFSGNEPDDDDDETERKDRVTGQKDMSKGRSGDQLLPSNSSQSQDVTGSPDKDNKMEVDIPPLVGSIGVKITPDLPSATVAYDSSLPLLDGMTSPMLTMPQSSSLQLSNTSSVTSIPVSPMLTGKVIPEIGEADISASELTVVNVEPIIEKQIESSGTEAQNTELKRRKLQRNKQVLKERFDEWEEAFKFEQEQRKMDEMFMREALIEAKKAAESWEVPVGAVLVQHGKIIARGCNLVEELRDSTAHAEMICIREASKLLRTWRIAEATLYVTLEPCAMCAGGILQARIDTVVYGAPNKLLGADGSWVSLFPSGNDGSGSERPAGPVHPFHPKMSIRRGILATECADVMQQFFQLRRKKNKKSDSPPSCLPVSTPSKFLSKMHDMFSMMFCL